MNVGAALHTLDDNRAAAEATERGLNLFDRLFRQEGRHDLAYRVAQSHANLGRILRALASPEQAMAHCEQAAEIFGNTALQQTPGETNRGLLARGMVNVSLQKLQLLCEARRADEALAYYEAVAPAIQRLIQEEGLSDQLAQLALTHVNAAGMFAVVGRAPEAVRLCDEAVRCYERALSTKVGRHLLPDLLRARVLRALLLSESNDLLRARAEARATVAFLRKEAEREPGEQTSRDLEWALRTLRQLL
jgi:tetratricopeptide (TPR) repeat protein